MYPSGSEKFTMQLDKAEEKKAEEFYFALAFIVFFSFLFLFSALPCNPFNVTLTGSSLESLLCIINDGNYRDQTGCRADAGRSEDSWMLTATSNK